MKRLDKKRKRLIKNLARKGYSLNRLVKTTSLPKSTIYYHVKNFVKKMSKPKLDKISNWERGYLVGLFVSDGHLTFNKKSYNYCIVFSLNAISEEKIAKNLIRILNKIGICSHETFYKNLRRVVCVSKKIYNYLKNYVIYDRINGLNKKVSLKNFSGWNSNFRFGFIAGYIDGDGYIGLDRGSSIRVLISTSRVSLSRQISEILNSLKIRNTIQFNQKESQYTIRLSTPFYKKYQNKIGCIKGSWSNGRTPPSHL